MKTHIKSNGKGLSFFERYLSIWVIASILAGILLGKFAPQFAKYLDSIAINVGGAPIVSIPIAICLFFMMYPIMVKIDFAEVLKAGKSIKPVGLTLVINWLIKPFTMYAISVFFLGTLFLTFIGPDAVDYVKMPLGLKLEVGAQHGDGTVVMYDTINQKEVPQDNIKGVLQDSEKDILEGIAINEKDVLRGNAINKNGVLQSSEKDVLQSVDQSDSSVISGVDSGLDLQSKTGMLPGVDPADSSVISGVNSCLDLQSKTGILPTSEVISGVEVLVAREKIEGVKMLRVPLWKSYFAGCILLGIAPCTAMVLVWGYLAKGSGGHTLVMVAINSLFMLLLYGPLGGFLLKMGSLPVPWEALVLSIGIYVALPLAAGYFSRKWIIAVKGEVWFKEKFLHFLTPVTILALLITLVLLFSFKGEMILSSPLTIVWIAIPLTIQTLLIFSIGYAAARAMNLTYEDAAPSAMIGASNHFEVAIATATMLFGLSSGAALATVVGVLIEVPLMLGLVKFCLKTQNFFGNSGIRQKA